MYPRNAASPERIAVGAVVLIADGTVQTSGVSITVVPQGGSTAAGGGTTSYEQGVVFYLPTQAETNYTSFIVTAYKASCIPVSATVVTTASATAGKVVLSGETHTSAVIPTVTTVGTLTTYTGNTPQTGDSFARLGAPAGASLSADAAAIKVDTAAVKVKTDFLPSATAGATGGVFVAGTNAATTITTGLTTTFTGNLTGSVGSVTGNVGGNVTGTVSGVTPAAAGAAMALTSGERTTLAGVVLTTQMTESYRTDGSAPTIAQALCETLGHMGESSISGTTKTVKKFDGSTSAATFTLNDATTPTAITRAT